MNKHILSQNDSAKQSPSSLIIPLYPTNGYVYLIGVVGHKVYKIGHSTSPARRMKTLQAQRDIPLELVAKILYDNCQSVEFQWQVHYKRYKLSGEWFALPDDEVEYFKRMAS